MMMVLLDNDLANVIQEDVEAIQRANVLSTNRLELHVIRRHGKP
jgi:hypothetical protein